MAALFDAHAAFLLSAVRRLAGPGPHVEDIVQEVFLRAHVKRRDLDRHPEPRAWLYRAARNLTLHHLRGKSRRESFLGGLAAMLGPEQRLPDDALVLSESQRAVHDCLASLPFEQREAFVLHEMEELGAREIAALVGTKEATVRSRLRLAREHFRRDWLRHLAKEGSHA